MHLLRRILAVLICSAAVTAQVAIPSTAIQGITISTHGNGSDWGSDRIVEAFAQVKEVGGTWVTVHPYASISKDGSVRFRDNNDGSPPTHWVRPIKEAHALGLKILIKPHLGYWGSGFSWRGDIDFTTDEQWARFFSDYEKWIVRMATACKDADAFVVGTELDRTLRFDAKWRGVIKKVRAQTKARLTYAANWTDYQSVGFWDALDLVGIQAYFPLSEQPSAPEATLRTAWKTHMKSLRAFSESKKKEIVFTELGYSRTFRAPVEPWAHESDGMEAEDVQERCLRVALEAIKSEPCVVGAFLWKWFPPPHSVGRDFQLASPRMKRTIRGVWGD